MIRIFLVTSFISYSVMATENHFIQCAACHSIQKGQNGLGPSLFDIVNRKSATVEGFRYSSALKRKKIVWTIENLNKFLKDPQGLVPGNRMPFAGIDDEEVRKSIIEYLKTNGKK